MLVGFNVETVEYKNISFTVWDVGGQVSKNIKSKILSITNIILTIRIKFVHCGDIIIKIHKA